MLLPMIGDAGGTRVLAGGGRAGQHVLGKGSSFLGKARCATLLMLLAAVPLAAVVTKVILAVPLNGKKAQSLPRRHVFA